MISETAHSSQTKLIGYDLHVGEQGIGYSNLTPDPPGARGTRGSFWGSNSNFTEWKNFAKKSCQVCSGDEYKNFSWVVWTPEGSGAGGTWGAKWESNLDFTESKNIANKSCQVCSGDEKNNIRQVVWTLGARALGGPIGAKIRIEFCQSWGGRG